MTISTGWKRLLIAVVFLVSACATNPVTGNREFAFMSESQEIAIGREADMQIQHAMGVYESLALQEYVEDLGNQLAMVSHRPDLPWQFTVVDSPAVNAFALPGGFIYLTRGIMAYLGDEAELAGVLGHEIGHVTARHAVQAYTRATGAQLGLVLGGVLIPPIQSSPYGLPGFMDVAGSGLGLLLLKFGREDEIQADRLGAEYAAGGSWNPGGVVGMLSTLGRISDVSDRSGVPNWLSTHPEPEARISEVEATVAKLLEMTNSDDFRVDRSGYLDRIKGLQFGDNPEDGIIRASEFFHAPLRFGFGFPEGWDVQNNETDVIIKQPGQEIYIQLSLAENMQGSGLREIAERDMYTEGYTTVLGNQTEINGLDAYLGSYRRYVNNVGQIVAQVAHIRHDRNLFVIGGFGPAQAFTRVERDVNSTIRSFRPLTQEEVDGIVPNEIALYIAREGDTWQQIADQGSGPIVQATTLAIMNGYPVNEQPRPGDRLKIVVSGM